MCSTSKVEAVRALGADHVIDYARADFADGRHRYDVILDTVWFAYTPQHGGRYLCRATARQVNWRAVSGH